MYDEWTITLEAERQRRRDGWAGAQRQAYDASMAVTLVLTIAMLVVGIAAIWLVAHEVAVLMGQYFADPTTYTP